MSDVLVEICDRKRRDVEHRREAVPLGGLEARLPSAPPRGFSNALRRGVERRGMALIAEIKKASPSRGLIRADFDPAALARAYADAGASCLSVLTDTPYFQGEDDHLRAARAAVTLPVLRKDFVLDAYQVIEARVLQADCILLIMAALDDAVARDLGRLARGLGMDVLVEVHDAAELDRALGLDLDCLLGINNRNLKTLKVDLATTEELAARAPPGTTLVAESGLGSHADLLRMQRAGASRFLVGERLMAEADVAAATRRLLGNETAP